MGITMIRRGADMAMVIVGAKAPFNIMSMVLESSSNLDHHVDGFSRLCKGLVCGVQNSSVCLPQDPRPRQLGHIFSRCHSARLVARCPVSRYMYPSKRFSGRQQKENTEPLLHGT